MSEEAAIGRTKPGTHGEKGVTGPSGGGRSTWGVQGGLTEAAFIRPYRCVLHEIVCLMTRAPLSPLHSFECIGSLVRVSTLGPRSVLVTSKTSPPEALPAGSEMRLRPEHTCCYCVCLCRIVVASADTHRAGTDGERKQKWEGEGELKSSDMSVGKCTLPTRVVGICPRHPFPITCSGKSSFPVLEAAPSSHWRQR
jgi:hypothetical protein